MSLSFALSLVYIIHSVIFPNIGVEAVVSTLSDIDSEFSSIVDEYFDKQSIVPVQTVGSPIAVTVDFDLVSVMAVDDDSRYITVAGYLTVEWTEERYITIADDIDISVSASFIWIPPLAIVNSLSSVSSIESNEDVTKFNLNTARVVWKPRIHVRVRCDSNSFFPFDKLECSLKISSLALDTTEMTLTAADDTVGMTSFEENNLWNLKSTSGTSYSLGSYPYVEYNFSIKRRGTYLMFIVACPVFVMSILHLFVFLLPLQSQQRPNYCALSMTGVLITLLWALSYIPTGMRPFSIVVYYLFIEFVVSLLVTALTLLLTPKTFSGCECCPIDKCCENLVSERKPKNVSNLHDSEVGSVRNVTEHATTTPNAVRVTSVTTAWDDDDVYPENPNSPESIPENKSDIQTKTCNKSPDLFMFMFFLCFHICFTVAFFIPLGLNVE